jgi:hypothetical protein
LLLHSIVMIEIVLRIIIVALIIALSSNHCKDQEESRYEGSKSSAQHGCDCDFVGVAGVLEVGGSRTLTRGVCCLTAPWRDSRTDGKTRRVEKRVLVGRTGQKLVTFARLKKSKFCGPLRTRTHHAFYY